MLPVLVTSACPTLGGLQVLTCGQYPLPPVSVPVLPAVLMAALGGTDNSARGNGGSIKLCSEAIEKDYRRRLVSFERAGDGAEFAQQSRGHRRRGLALGHDEADLAGRVRPHDRHRTQT